MPKLIVSGWEANWLNQQMPSIMPLLLSLPRRKVYIVFGLAFMIEKKMIMKEILSMKVITKTLFGKIGFMDDQQATSTTNVMEDIVLKDCVPKEIGMINVVLKVMHMCVRGWFIVVSILIKIPIF